MVTQTVTVVLGDREFGSIERAFAQFGKNLRGSFDRAAPKASRELLRSLQRVAREMERLHSTPWRPGGSGRNLFRRSGSGLRSIRQSIRVTRAATLQGISGQIGADFPMSFHEEGGTVRPVRAQYLTVPLPAALDARGIPRAPSARDWDNTFIARSRRGNLLIFQRRADGIVPLYVLKRSVTIPPRLRLGETLFRQGLPFFEQRLLRVIDQELDKVA